MGTDLENIVGLLVQIVLTISWLCMFGFAIWLFVLWVKLSRDSKDNGGFLSKVFPVFIFTPSVLSDAGKAERATFVKVFYVFIFLVVLSIALLFVGESLPALKFPENV
jgi:hypothetical protein